LLGPLLPWQLLDLSLPWPLFARVLEGQPAADAELHQTGVTAAPAQAVTNVHQQQQQSKKKGKVALILQDQSLALQPVSSCRLQSQT